MTRDQALVTAAALSVVAIAALLRRRVDGAALRALLAFGVAVLAPLLVVLPAAGAHGAGFAHDFAMALGYAAAALLGLQFALTARLRRAVAPFGVDLAYYLHRLLSVLAVLIVLAHYGILRAAEPALLDSADPRFAPPHVTAGRVALALFVALVVLSLARQRLRFDYDWWRWTHALFAATAFGLTLWHVLGAGRYLDTGWKSALWIGYTVLWLGLLAYARVRRPWRVARAPYRVAEVRPERGRVVTLVLEPHSGRVPPFSPGQFGWLSLRASPYAMRDHPFSIASSAARCDRLELSIKELGDFTRTVRDVRPGERAWFDAPYGNFGCDRLEGARGFVFVAGGIGIAPMASMLRTLADRGDRRRHLLIYGNRNLERVALREELESLARRLDLEVIHVLHEPEAGWTGERGVITQEVLARHCPTPPDGYEFFVCGPDAMLRAVERSLAALGVPAARVHAEIFDWV